MNIKKNAFTLIELLVVIVIIGILSTISVATFQGYFEKARLAKAQSFAIQVERQLLTESTASENNFVGWYNFQNEGDISQDSPYIKDSSPSKINISSTSGGGTFEQSDDTPLDKGWALKLLGGKSLQRWLTPINNQSLTLAAWIKVISPRTNTRHSTILLRSGNTSASGLAVNNGNEVLFYINNSLSNSVKTEIDLDKWHYIVGTLKDGQMKIWLDGDLASEAPKTLNAPLEHDYIRLGDSSATGFEGLIDDIIITSIPFDGLK